MSLISFASFSSWKLYLGFCSPSKPGHHIATGCVRGPSVHANGHTNQRQLLHPLQDLGAISIHFYFFMFFYFPHLCHKIIASRPHVFCGNPANYKERTLDKEQKLRVCGPTMSPDNVWSWPSQINGILYRFFSLLFVLKIIDIYHVGTLVPLF